MYLTTKQQLKHLSKEDYAILRHLCHVAKSLANEAIYNIRQHFFKTGKYLSYKDNYTMLKNSPNYRTLNSNMAQQILREVDGSFKSFFALRKLSKEGKYSAKKVKIPRYLPKDGYLTLVISMVRINGNKLILPYSNSYKKTHKLVEITIPPILMNANIKEIRIIPKAHARFFEVQYTREVNCTPKETLNKQHALAIDLGVSNLMTCVTNQGKTFIIDGKKLKSINQWYNKENSRLQGIKDKQHIKGTTHRQQLLAIKRNNRVNDYISKAAKMVIGYCLENDIGTLVVGYNNDFQQNTKLNKQNNQNLVNIPFGRLCSKLKYLCEMNGVEYILQEESYTSQASFWHKDFIPVYKPGEYKSYEFSGKRPHRGLYKTNDGKYKFNADVNGALNIMRKCNVVDLTILYARGDVSTPIRIRVA